MRNTVRWILVLPAAICALILAGFISLLGTSFLPPLVCQWWQGWICSLVFVLSGAAVAPRHKFAAAIVLVAIHAMFLGVSLTLGLTRGVDTPTWNLVVCCIISFVGALGACGLVWEKEKKKGRDAAQPANLN